MSEFEPPIAAQRPHLVKSPHGDREDPYYWLRDDDRAQAEVLAHLAAENAYKARSLEPLMPLADTLYAEIVARLKPDDASVPYRKNGYWYYTRYEAGKEYPIFARRARDMAAPEEIMVDANTLAAGHEYYQIGELDVSPDGQWLAFCEDTVGRRQYVIRFKNLRTGEYAEHGIPNAESDLAWANDNRTLLYVEKDEETLLGLRVKKHRLGTHAGDDVLVFEQTDTSLYTGVSKSKSDRFLFIHMEGTLISEWHYADADDPALAFKVFLPRRPDHEYEVEHLHDRFVIRTNWAARNFRLMWVPIGLEHDTAEWQDLVPHREDAYLEDFDVFTSFIALAIRSGALRRIAILPLTESGMFFIDSDEPTYTMFIGANPEIDSNALRYAYSSLTTPATVYEFDVPSRMRTVLKRDTVLGGFESADYASELLFAPARDGKSIPVSLIHRKGVTRDSSAPLLQYAYGSYGLSSDPGFAAARFSLIDRGFVYAIAHVRGGQEMGRDWYDDGRLLCKLNTFNDFIDVTRFLVERGIAARDRVFAMGGSAGGLLMGAIANMSPGDYRGIVAQVPFVDVVTTMLDDSIPLTTNEYDEWGNPHDRTFYEYMLSYSPYDNVRAQDYPAMLVTTGLWDSQVQYYEPAKWVARLRQLKTDDNPLLLHVDMDAGHGGKAGRFQRYRETAMEYAFILGVDASRPATKKSAASGGS